MNSGVLPRGVLLFAISFSAAATPLSAFAAKAQLFTGTVSDAMCGAQHMMAGDAASCLRTCVDKGSKYALVVGDKVYTLETKDKASSDALYKLAGQQARVKGEANGDSIVVESVAAAK